MPSAWAANGRSARTNSTSPVFNLEQRILRGLVIAHVDPKLCLSLDIRVLYLPLGSHPHHDTPDLACYSYVLHASCEWCVVAKQIQYKLGVVCGLTRRTGSRS
jgi:hypothetical protein